MQSVPMPASQPSAKKFYAVMAFAALAVAILGFVPTYFMPLAGGTFAAPAIVHIHAAFFFGWTLFFCLQTWLVYAGRTPSHREWGMAGIALATAMVFSVFIAAGAMVHLRTAAGYGPEALAFTWVQVGGMLFFGGAVAVAIANVRTPEVHKRLMLLATLSLLDAPIARWVLGFTGAIPATGAPPAVSQIFAASLIADLMLLAAIAFDWRTRGRPHQVYLIGGAALIVFQATRTMVSETAAWQAIASWIAGLAG
jgi:hypothetical protein